MDFFFNDEGGGGCAGIADAYYCRHSLSDFVFFCRAISFVDKRRLAPEFRKCSLNHQSLSFIPSLLSVLNLQQLILYSRLL